MADTERKLEKLEDKMDKVKEDVIELKTEFRVHTDYMKDKMVIFEDHITGDKKIISELSPVLSKLPTIVAIAEEYNYKKMAEEDTKKKRESFRKRVGFYVGIAVSISSIIFGIFRFM